MYVRSFVSSTVQGGARIRIPPLSSWTGIIKSSLTHENRSAARGRAGSHQAVIAAHKARAGLVVFAMGFFATGVLPEFVTSLAFFALASLIAVAPPEVIFAGWASTAMWLTVGGLIVGIAVNRTGLGARLASRLTGLFGEKAKMAKGRWSGKKA